ncbi:MAG: hypothetical protein R3C20_21240 [Planctomycetaceae bacterium]
MAFEFEKIRSILVCPKSRSELVMEGDTLISTCAETRLRYAIVDDIPRLIVDEAQTVEQDAWSAIMQKHGRNPQTGEVAAP